MSTTCRASVKGASFLASATALALSLSCVSNPTTTVGGTGGSISGSGGHDAGADSPGDTGGGAGGKGGAAGAGGAGTGSGGIVTGSGGKGGAAGAGGAGTGSGGIATGSGGVVGSGGSIPQASALTCGSVSVAAADVISDFSQATPLVYQTGTPQRGGTGWYAYTATGKTKPTITIDANTTGPCAKGGALKVTSGGNDDWGDGIGMNFVPDVTSSPAKKGTWDGSQYTGIGFWAKCQTETPFVLFKVVDAANDNDIPTPTCFYDKAPYCNQYGIKNVAIQTGWTYYKVYFDELLQDPKVAGPYGNGLSKSTLTAFQIQMNTPYDTNGSKVPQSAYSCWIDDVHFLKTASPAPQTTCASNYTTSGNKIMCGSTQKIFRGVARPSLEWDTAGFNITPWDMANIKSWKANVVRIGLNQEYYMGSQYSGIYPKYVARAVKWAEAAGMDVILDLHWVDSSHQSPTQNYMAGANTGSPSSTAFWSAIATAFKTDKHVMFELYNEPTLGSGSPQSGDWSNWQTNMQALYNSVRNAGAPQIAIIGGLNWAYDLTGVSSHLIKEPNGSTGTNIVYNTHPYADKAQNQGSWDTNFGNLAATTPVFATEFGTYDCSGSWTTNLINYFESKGISWTAWAWYVAPTTPTDAACKFPALLSSYSGAVLSGGNADAAKTGLAKNP